jgi:hypothetical protein
MDWTKAARGERGLGGRALARERMAWGVGGFGVPAVRFSGFRKGVRAGQWGRVDGDSRRRWKKKCGRVKRRTTVAVVVGAQRAENII